MHRVCDRITILVLLMGLFNTGQIRKREPTRFIERLHFSDTPSWQLPEYQKNVFGEPK